jgi:N-acylneuraminate cytidylyltransferase
MAIARGRVLAVIPARGGSKGIPRKNLASVGGLPLIAHSIRCALAVSSVDRVVVSTDDEELAEVARAHGAEVPFMRPPHLATDDAPLLPVLRHAHEEMEARHGPFAVHVLLQPTSPLRLPEDVAGALAMLDGVPEIDGVVGCSEPSWNPFYVGVVDDGARLRPAFPHAPRRRQDAPRFLRINGMVYAWCRAALFADGSWLDARHRPYLIPDQRAIDVDAPDDLAMARLLVESGTVRLPWLPHAEKSGV